MIAGGRGTTVRAALQSDSSEWLRMRCDLWHDDEADHAREIARYFAGDLAEPQAVLVAVDPGGRLIGFAELSIRNRAEGCYTSNVAFLEGWYVVPHARRRGVGAALVLAAEAWGRRQGCTEFGSDTQHDNRDSVAAHRALGFKDAGELRCFYKLL